MNITIKHMFYIIQLMKISTTAKQLCPKVYSPSANSRTDTDRSIKESPSCVLENNYIAVSTTLVKTTRNDKQTQYSTNNSPRSTKPGSPKSCQHARQLLCQDLNHKVDKPTNIKHAPSHTSLHTQTNRVIITPFPRKNTATK